mgnify:CR=1 FL=1
MCLCHFDLNKDYGFTVRLFGTICISNPHLLVAHKKKINICKQRFLFLLADRPGSSFIAKDRPVVVVPLEEFICSFIAQLMLINFIS